jgi:hypothetical protein
MSRARVMRVAETCEHGAELRMDSVTGCRCCGGPIYLTVGAKPVRVDQGLCQGCLEELEPPT